MTKVVLFFKEMGPAGGVETFEYYLGKHFLNDKDLEFEFWAQKWNDEQLSLMSTVGKCVKWEGQKIICDTFVFASRDVRLILNYVEAKKIIEVFHMANNLGWNTLTDPRVTNYISVSKAGADVFERASGKKCEVYYPIIELDKNKYDHTKYNDGKLHLISCSRLDTADKGAKRMKYIANVLDKLNIDYEWTIYGIIADYLNNKGINFKGKTLDKDTLFSEISRNDFFVQLSDAEGFGISISEALHLDVPIISTPISVLNEHLVNKDNCIVCNFDCSNIIDVLNKMLNKKFEFEYVGQSSDWRSLLLS